MTDEPIDAELVEEAQTLPAVRASEAIVARGELTVDEVVAQKDKILQIMQRVMQNNVHYGVIPGVNKPSLLKPGAEAINVALRLAPHYASEKIWHDDGHLTVSVVCELHHIPTGLVIATGEGLCTSRESKYAYRNEKRTCPACGAPAIIKGKAEYGGGWVCWKKADTPGCGANYAEGDAAITGQPQGKVPNPELPDTFNTVLKMADKRALVAAVLNGTAASDVFTQDVEERAAGGEEASAPAENPRSEGPGKFPVPKSWAKVQEAVRQCDNPDEAWPVFEAFVRAASYHLFGQTDSKQLSAEQRKTMLQKAAGATVALHDTPQAASVADFVIFDVAHQRKAWASVLDGTVLETPDVDAQPLEPEEELERLARIAQETIDGAQA